MVSSKEKKCVRVFKSINIDLFFLYVINKKDNNLNVRVQRKPHN